MMTKLKFKTVFLISAMAISITIMLSGCAITDKTDNKTDNKTSNIEHQIADPIEPVNRFIFGFNDILDKIIIEPVAKAYRFIVPTPARDSIHNFMINLRTPITLANNILQGDISGAGVTTARFFINTTIGVGGLFDFATQQGYSYKEEDFGQTLASWGVDDGFYLVLPIIGPSTLRDTAGIAVDTIGDPIRIIAHNNDEYDLYYARILLHGLDDRSRLLGPIDDLKLNSLDYYAAMRSAYIQKRQSLIYNKNSDKKTTPSYEDFE